MKVGIFMVIYSILADSPKISFVQAKTEFSESAGRRFLSAVEPSSADNTCTH